MPPTPRQGWGPNVCPLFDALLWAREVQKAFSNGIEVTAVQLRRHLKDIGELPAAGAIGELVVTTAADRAEAAELLKRDDFFTQIPAIQTKLKNLQVVVADGCKALSAAQSASLVSEVQGIESMPEWTKLGSEQQNRFSERFDNLRITVSEDLDGIRKLLNHQYAISTELERVRAEIRDLTKTKPSEPLNGNARKPATEVAVQLPAEITSAAELDLLIGELEKVRGKLDEFERVVVKWM